MAFQLCFALIVLCAFITNRVHCVDMKKTDIKVVTDETRYCTRNPNATYRALDKVNHAKGNIIFSSGPRIDVFKYGDDLTNAFSKKFDELCHPQIICAKQKFRKDALEPGDRLLFTIMDETQFARFTDIEVSLWYPAEGHDGQIISCVDIVTDLSTSDADVFFVNDGGIGSTYAEMLMVANRTNNFGYQLYWYGY